MPTFSRISISRPITTIMLFSALAFLGLFAFNQLGIDLLPNIYLPHLVVQTTYQNATPEEIEKLVTEPLESAIGTVSGVKKVNSISKEGISVISVDFVWGTDMNFALLQLREKLDNVSFVLPREAGRPTIIRADPSASPILSLVLSYKNATLPGDSPGSDRQIGRFVDHSSSSYEIKRLIELKEASRVIFKRRFEQIDGVAQAILTGGLEREIVVEIDPLLMRNYNLTFEQVAQALKSSNVNLPAGTIMKGLFRYSLRTFGEFTGTDQIGKTIIKYLPNGSVLKLNDIAEVKENFKEREGLTRLNSAETVGVLIYKQPEANTVSIAQKVKDVIKILQEEYPEFNLLVVSDQSGFIQDAITNVKQEILYGGILATIVLFFFLGNVRNIFAIAVTIPASLVITILLMYLFKINFNIISLGGIAVGVGMLLDNSIVVIENIIRHREKGLSLKDSAVIGASEVSMPVAAATLTTIVVFLPLIFVRGITGEIFRDQSLAIVFSLTASILAALTLIPMIVSRKSFVEIDKSKYSGSFIFIDKPLRNGIGAKVRFALVLPFIVLYKTVKFISVKGYLAFNGIFQKIFKKFFTRVDKWMDGLIHYYEQLLLWSLDNRAKVVLIGAGLLIASAFALIDIKKEFIPESAQDEFVVELIFPKGTSLRGNAEITSEIERAILQIPSVKNVVSNIGRVNEFDFLNKEQISVNKTNLIVKLNSYENYYDTREGLRAVMKNLAGIEYSFKQVKTTFTQLITPSEYDVEIKIKNKNIENAFSTASIIVEETKARKIAGVKEIVVGLEKGLPGYSIQIDREKCLAYGVNINDVINTIVASVKGNEATYFSDFDKKVAVRITTSQESKDDIDKIMQREVRSNGRVVNAGNLVNLERTETYSEIRREGQARTLSVFVDIDDANIEDVVKELTKLADELPESKNEMITIGGVNEEISDSFSKLYIALIISVMLMYMILASEFESLLYPFIIIFSVPLGLVGGILLLYILGESISIISLMGLIILAGIADNDAVVKVEFILRKRKEGLSVRDAIMQAGHDRFRPIVMNSLTVIFGLIPMIIGIGAATQLRISLALAIAGGLVSATVLTLIIIPVLYTFFEKKNSH